MFPGGAGTEGYGRYQYAGNNPTNWSDPNGESVCGILAVFGLHGKGVAGACFVIVAGLLFRAAATAQQVCAQAGCQGLTPEQVEELTERINEFLRQARTEKLGPDAVPAPTPEPSPTQTPPPTPTETPTATPTPTPTPTSTPGPNTGQCQSLNAGTTTPVLTFGSSLQGGTHILNDHAWNSPDRPDGVQGRFDQKYSSEVGLRDNFDQAVVIRSFLRIDYRWSGRRSACIVHIPFEFPIGEERVPPSTRASASLLQMRVAVGRASSPVARPFVTTMFPEVSPES